MIEIPGWIKVFLWDISFSTKPELLSGFWLEHIFRSCYYWISTHFNPSYLVTRLERRRRRRLGGRHISDMLTDVAPGRKWLGRGRTSPASTRGGWLDNRQVALALALALALFLSHWDLKRNHSQSDLKLVHQPLMTSHQITFLVLMTLNWVINYFIRYKVFVIKFWTN